MNNLKVTSKRGKNKKFKLKKELKECFKYIRESKNFIYSIIILFFTFALIGFFVPAPESLIKQILEYIQELIEKTEGMSQLELIWFIFQNNALSSFWGLILGVFLGIFPVIITALNGYILGFVALAIFQNESFLSLWKLLPHGIFELTAVFISLGMGLRLGMAIFHKDKTNYIKKNLLTSLKVFLLIILPLLILAAIIEGTLIFLFKY